MKPDKPYKQGKMIWTVWDADGCAIGRYRETKEEALEDADFLLNDPRAWNFSGVRTYVYVVERFAPRTRIIAKHAKHVWAIGDGDTITSEMWTFAHRNEQ